MGTQFRRDRISSPACRLGLAEQDPVAGLGDGIERNASAGRRRAARPAALGTVTNEPDLVTTFGREISSGRAGCGEVDQLGSADREQRDRQDGEEIGQAGRDDFVETSNIGERGIRELHAMRRHDRDPLERTEPTMLTISNRVSRNSIPPNGSCKTKTGASAAASEHHARGGRPTAVIGSTIVPDAGSASARSPMQLEPIAGHARPHK